MGTSQVNNIDQSEHVSDQAGGAKAIDHEVVIVGTGFSGIGTE